MNKMNHTFLESKRPDARSQLFSIFFSLKICKKSQKTGLLQMQTFLNSTAYNILEARRILVSEVKYMVVFNCSKCGEPHELPERYKIYENTKFRFVCSDCKKK
jgi:transposase-like protein